VSLIYSMLGEVRSFSATLAVADRREGGPVNRWSPYSRVIKHKYFALPIDDRLTFCGSFFDRFVAREDYPI
jgi:hypothetical protein